MKKLKYCILAAAMSVAFIPNSQAQFIDLVSFGSSNFQMDPGSDPIFSQSATAITMGPSLAISLGSTWYNESMTKFVSDWSADPDFYIAMSVEGVNPGLAFGVTFYDTSFGTINIYDSNTGFAGSSLSYVPLSLAIAGNNNLSDVQFIQFTWGADGSLGATQSVTVEGIAAVPEPSTYALIALSALAFGAYSAKRRRK